MFFGRNEIHIQAFQETPAAKWIPRNSSSLTFHHFQEFIIFNYQKFKNSKFQKNKKWTLKVSKKSKFLKFRILRKYFPFFQGCSLIFLDLVQVIPQNKMKKYGLPGPKTSRNDEILSFRPLMPWNRHFISSIWRRKIQLRH